MFTLALEKAKEHNMLSLMHSGLYSIYKARLGTNHHREILSIWELRVDKDLMTCNHLQPVHRVINVSAWLATV